MVSGELHLHTCFCCASCLPLMGYHLSAASFSGLCLPKGSLSSSSFSPQSFCSVDGACGSHSSLPPHLVLLIPPRCRHSQPWPRILPACQTLTHHTFHHCALECLVTLAGFLCLRSVFSGAEAAGVRELLGLQTLLSWPQCLACSKDSEKTTKQNKFLLLRL